MFAFFILKKIARTNGVDRLLNCSGARSSEDGSLSYMPQGSVAIDPWESNLRKPPLEYSRGQKSGGRK